ncbi:MAG: hypothetical protein MUF19_00240 [Candidatus Pacebacteria bacterium]|jgi:hypothetical protein|nr:hypothetical protein [Candidatus Paceibacterota bacterium]
MATLGDALRLYLRKGEPLHHRFATAQSAMNVMLFSLPNCDTFADVKSYVEVNSDTALTKTQQEVYEKLDYCWNVRSY